MIPLRRPESILNDPFLSRFIDNSGWELLLNTASGDYHAINEVMESTYPDSWSLNVPSDLRRRLERIRFRQPMGTGFDDEGLIGLVESAAEIMVTPTNGMDTRTKRRKLKRIRLLISILTKWRLMGYKPNDKTTLRVLVA